MKKAHQLLSSPKPNPNWATRKATPAAISPAPIIAALERHAAEQGGYPETLAALVPAYLEAVPTADAIDLTYRHTEASYELEFHYAGPGMNVCTYTPEGGWDCYGYY